MNVTKCCCFSLRTGVLIIGGLILASNFIGLLVSVRGLTQRELTQQRFRQPFVDENAGECNEKCINNFDKLYLIMAITSLVYQVINIVIGGLLIFGVHRNLPWCLRPFLVMSAVQTTAIVLLWMVGMFVIVDMLTTVVITIPIYIVFYFVLVVKSYMDEISGNGLHSTIENNDEKSTKP